MNLLQESSHRLCGNSAELSVFNTHCRLRSNQCLANWTWKILSLTNFIANASKCNLCSSRVSLEQNCMFYRYKFVLSAQQHRKYNIRHLIGCSITHQNVSTSLWEFWTWPRKDLSSRPTADRQMMLCICCILHCCRAQSSHLNGTKLLLQFDASPHVCKHLTRCNASSFTVMMMMFAVNISRFTGLVERIVTTDETCTHWIAPESTLSFCRSRSSWWVLRCSVVR